MNSKIENVIIDYKGEEVKAKKLTVTSILPINIETAWAKVSTSELLGKITKGKVIFKPVNGKFPRFWEEGMTVETRMLIYGLIPFGGVHTIYFEKINSDGHIFQTRENDSAAKVWNHKISMTEIDNGHIAYKDEIIIYGRVLNNIMAWWAKSFYEYRQKRWLKIAKEIVL